MLTKVLSQNELELEETNGLSGVTAKNEKEQNGNGNYGEKPLSEEPSSLEAYHVNSKEFEVYPGKKSKRKQIQSSEREEKNTLDVNLSDTEGVDISKMIGLNGTTDESDELEELSAYAVEKPKISAHGDVSYM